MSATPRTLPVIESCDGCGACCLVVTTPPFRHDLQGDGEATWVRLEWERPELLAEIAADAEARKAAGAPSYGTPCLWFDPATRRCRHYDDRPRACRDFALGGPDCRDARRRAGVPVSSASMDLKTSSTDGLRSDTLTLKRAASPAPARAGDPSC